MIQAQNNGISLQIMLNSFATDIFRKQADLDYISARANFKLQFRQQFLWSSQQAIEKYLKAILLFNGKSSCSYSNSNGEKTQFSHKLSDLYSEVLKLGLTGFELSDRNKEFLNYLQDQGGYNRYLSKSSYNISDAIQTLDSLVWHIRRYCQFIPSQSTSSTPNAESHRAAQLASINQFRTKKSPHQFCLHGGELEKILNKSKSNLARQTLIWANLWFGSKKRTKVTYSSFSSSEVPPNERPWFKQNNMRILKKYIKF